MMMEITSPTDHLVYIFFFKKPIFIPCHLNSGELNVSIVSLKSSSSAQSTPLATINN
eukprot:m.59001 g.59001  ORF g.59001 m.59001 type:complete len:57 (+) comp7891_c2_seq5:1525-1695(+)